MIKASVIGATGYVGAELMRLLAAHPRVDVRQAVSKNFAGKQLSDLYSSFFAAGDAVLSETEEETIAKQSDFVFLCLPHGQSMALAPAFARRGVKVIDLSGDFRYKDAEAYEAWYSLPHTERALNKTAVYGLPEYRRGEVAAASLVANPGCYTTTSILALAPLLQNNLISPEGIVIDAKSGVSGAGRKDSLAFSFCETADNFKAYSVTGHRHTSEIEEQLSLLSGTEVTLLFTPHLLPVKRGILATCYGQLNPGVTADIVYDAYLKRYENEPFTHILPPGRLPELKQVVGSNNCYIGFDISERTGRIVVISCTDNLLKGASGQAVQNFNIMNGIEETTGLSQIAWYL